MKKIIKLFIAFTIMFGALVAANQPSLLQATGIENEVMVIDENTPPPTNGAKVGNSKTRASNQCDNILYPGEYAGFGYKTGNLTPGAGYLLDYFYFTISGNNGAGYWNPVVGGWIPHANTVKGGNTFSIWNHKTGMLPFQILAVDTPSNSVLINTASGNVWVFATYMTESMGAIGRTCV